MRSRPLRCGNEMTNCSDVYRGRGLLMLLNEGFSCSNDDDDDA